MDFSEGGFSKPLSPAMSQAGSQGADDGYAGSMRDGVDSAQGMFLRLRIWSVLSTPCTLQHENIRLV